MAGRLNGKRGLITGGARGIGAGIARAMASEGATLYIADIDAAGVARVAAELGAVPLALDVTNEEDWQRAADEIGGAHGRLDILVNNAGTEIVRAIDKMSSEESRKVLAVNLEGPMAGCRACLSLLAAAGSTNSPASVINISSVAALIGQPELSAYSVSKAAVAHLSRVLAVEWPAQGHMIRVNSILPGCISTPMLEDTVKNWVDQGILDPDTAWKKMKDLSPMHRIGDVSDIAMGAVYLASDEARFVSGIDLVIDGGWTAT